jgi:hypothetical protein
MNKHLRLLCCKGYGVLSVLLLLAAIAPLAVSETLSISVFGLKPDTRENAVPAVKRALAACVGKSGVTLVFPKGRYDFFRQDCPEKIYHESNTTDTNPKICPILLENLKGVTIDGSGSDFIFHGQMQPFTVDRCEKVVIQNVNVDWDIPLTAQGEVVASEKDHVDLRIDPVQFPFVVEDRKLVFTGEDWKSPWGGVMEFDRDSHLIPPGTGDETLAGGLGNMYKAEKIGDDMVRINKRIRNLPKKGNFLVLRHNERIHSGIFLFHSRDVQVRNVNLYNTGGLGVLSQFTENIVLDNTNVIPNAAKGRYLSGHDDGAHFSNCRGQITVENCRFAGLMDDPINVHGTCVRIMEKRGEKALLCRFMHAQSVGMEWGRPGESIGFIEHEGMSTVGTGTLAAFTPSSLTEFEVTFTEPVPAEMKEGDALENLTWAPDVLLRKNHFGSCRARGVLISTPGKVVIEDNVFESSGSAILVAGDSNYWYESGAVRDVLIRKNTFNAPCLANLYQFCEGIISIYPEIPKPEKAPRPFHRNIRIEENTFHPFDYPVLYALSTEGLTFSNNTIIRSSDYEPYHKNQHMIRLVGCKGVTIAGNTLQGDVLGRDVFVEKMDASEVTVADGQGIARP